MQVTATVGDPRALSFASTRTIETSGTLLVSSLCQESADRALVSESSVPAYWRCQCAAESLEYVSIESLVPYV